MTCLGKISLSSKTIPLGMWHTVSMTNKLTSSVVNGTNTTVKIYKEILFPFQIYRCSWYCIYHFNTIATSNPKYLYIVSSSIVEF